MTTYDLKKIHELLIKGFGEDELRDIARYENDFRELKAKIPTNASKADIANILIDYADERKKIKPLLKWAKARNIERYNDYIPYEVAGDASPSEISPHTTPTNLRQAVILTAISVEYKAVRSYLSNIKETVHEQGTVYKWGTFPKENPTWKVAVSIIGAGNTKPAFSVERAINTFKPEVILFVGVAGGIKDVKIGDVVIATKIYNYESGKAEDDFKPRPQVGNTSYALQQRALIEANEPDWLDLLGDPPPTQEPQVFVGPIASGEKVVASKRSAVWQLIRSNYGDALALEMEGHGFLDAVHASAQVAPLVIRGISDLIDGKSDADAGGSQEMASRHASAFAFHILDKLGKQT